MKKRSYCSRMLYGRFYEKNLNLRLRLTVSKQKPIIKYVMSETKQNLERKKDNKYLLEKQLETLKLFFERRLLTQG